MSEYHLQVRTRGGSDSIPVHGSVRDTPMRILRTAGRGSLPQGIRFRRHGHVDYSDGRALQVH